MPHLSPMNWIMMFTSMTMLIMLMNSNFWWKSKSKFLLAPSQLKSSSSTWNW